MAPKGVRSGWQAGAAAATLRVIFPRSEGRPSMKPNPHQMSASALLASMKPQPPLLPALLTRLRGAAARMFGKAER